MPKQTKAEGRTLRACRTNKRTTSLAAIAWLSLTAFAQPPTPVVTPPTRDEIRGTTRPAAPDGRPRLTVEGELPGASCALDRPEFADIRVTPSAVMFEDLRGLSQEELRGAYAPYLGTDQPISVICRIRDRASAILREAGYIAAVEVPEQRIEGGEIRLRVLMAKLVSLRVRGDAGANERLVASYLRNLEGQEVFNRNQAERYLLLAGDIPGMNVRLALRPAGTVPGEVVGEVTVVSLPGQLDVNLQNLGASSVGREGALVRGQLFGLTGMGDRTAIAFYSTLDFEEQQTLQVSHDFRLGDEGLQIAAQGTYSWAHPDTGNALLDIRSKTFFASIGARYPFIRRQRFSLIGGAGLDWSDQDVTFNGIDLSRDHLRTLFATVDFAAAAPVSQAERSARLGPRWRLDGGIELRQGIDIFDASPACGNNAAACLQPGVVPPSRFEGVPTATVARARLAGEMRIVPQISFHLGAMGQFAFDPLLAFEEFSTGNYTVGRGYDPATLVGDRGVGVQAELRFGRLDPQGPMDLDVQPYVFFDAAWVGNEDQLFITTGRQDLRSIGGGLRAVLGDKVQLDAALAVPLTQAGLLTERPDPRILISITTRLWPWSSR